MSATAEAIYEEDQQFTSLPVSSITPKDGFNPRKFFDDAEFAELKASVKAHGVFQPIVVRPSGTEGQFHIVVGERRWRAAKEVGLESMPVVIRDMDESQAVAVATAENTVRADMSPAEEARAAHRLVSALEGDKDEATRVLGWSRSKLDKRVMLLHCSNAVLDALTERKIKTGHAELLATLPKETQNGTVETIISEHISVSDLKARLSSFALELNAAIFDRSGCVNCPHNSTTQRSLFEENIGEGRCTNQACFRQKTDAALEALKAKLQEQYSVVYTDTERSPGSYTLLSQNGPKGVGMEQYAACLGCKHFGALMSTQPGEEGRAAQNLCFNLECHADKVKAYQEAVQATQSVSAEAAPKASAATGNTPATASSNAASSNKSTASKSTATEQPKRVTEQSRRVLKEAAVKAVKQDNKAAMAIVVSSLANLIRLGTGKGKALGSGNREDALAKAYEMSGEDQKAVLTEAVFHILSGGETSADYQATPLAVRLSAQLFKMTGLPLEDSCVIDEEFLKAHTKSGIRSLMHEAGFDTWYCEQEGSDKAFDKLMSRKSAEIIDVILNRGKEAKEKGFDFGGFVPSSVSKLVK